MNTCDDDIHASKGELGRTASEVGVRSNNVQHVRTLDQRATFDQSLTVRVTRTQPLDGVSVRVR
jgi:hypothetical protein